MTERPTTDESDLDAWVARIKAAKSIDEVIEFAKETGALIHVDRRSSCDHQFDGPIVEFDGGLAMSTTCSKCGMASINDPRIWEWTRHS